MDDSQVKGSRGGFFVYWEFLQAYNPKHRIRLNLSNIKKIYQKKNFVHALFLVNLCSLGILVFWGIFNIQMLFFQALLIFSILTTFHVLPFGLDGSDQAFALIMITVFLVSLSDEQLVRNVGLWFLTLQCCLV